MQLDPKDFSTDIVEAAGRAQARTFFDEMLAISAGNGLDSREFAQFAALSLIDRQNALMASGLLIEQALAYARGFQVELEAAAREYRGGRH